VLGRFKGLPVRRPGLSVRIYAPPHFTVQRFARRKERDLSSRFFFRQI